MAVQAERGVTDSVLIEKTKVILDTLTPQVLESEFPRVLERIQERRELIQVLGELDPKLIAELRQEDVEEDGSREYLQDDAELRTILGGGVDSERSEHEWIVHADAHMGDEFKLAVEAAVEHNLAYVRDNWDRIRVATGFYPGPALPSSAPTS